MSAARKDAQGSIEARLEEAKGQIDGLLRELGMEVARLDGFDVALPYVEASRLALSQASMHLSNCLLRGVLRQKPDSGIDS